MNLSGTRFFTDRSRTGGRGRHGQPRL